MYGATKDMIDIVSTYCETEACIKSVHQSAFSHFNFQVTHMRDAYPNDLDPAVKNHLESIESTILLLGDTDDAEEVVETLTELQNGLRESSDINESDKNLGLAAGSIAIESTKQWTTVLNDPDHPLNAVDGIGMRPGHQFHRNLQFTFGVDLEALFQAANITKTHLIIFFDVLALVMFLGFPIPAIFASYFAFAYIRNYSDED